jgi:Uma2 family endonuclease
MKLHRLCAADHGRPTSFEEYRTARFAEGHQYELVDGKLYAYPTQDPAHSIIESWLHSKLWDYSRQHPERINYISFKAGVFISGRPGVTFVGPDLTCYCDFPRGSMSKPAGWDEVSPFLVCEVAYQEDPRKDFVRNVELYLQVPSIQEYWLVDIREDAECPRIRFHRRSEDGWQTVDRAYRELYSTELLPGFQLLVDPRDWHLFQKKSK